MIPKIRHYISSNSLIAKPQAWFVWVEFWEHRLFDLDDQSRFTIWEWGKSWSDSVELKYKRVYKLINWRTDWKSAPNDQNLKYQQSSLNFCSWNKETIKPHQPPEHPVSFPTTPWLDLGTVRVAVGTLLTVGPLLSSTRAHGCFNSRTYKSHVIINNPTSCLTHEAPLWFWG